MKSKLLFGILLAIILAFSLASPGLAQKGPPNQAKPSTLASAATSPWFTGWADKNTSADVGSYPSIAYNPVDGLPYISYYDAVNKNLMLANPVSSGGNCGDSNRWSCQVVDGDSTSNGKTDGDVGQYSSIALWRPTGISTIHWKLGISYHDATDHALKLAILTQGVSRPSWAYSTILAYGTIVYPDNDVGTYTSLKFSSAGIPYISYYSHLYQDPSYAGYANIANQVASGGNCGMGTDAGKWNCDFLEGGVNIGMGLYTSLDIGYDDVPYISYVDFSYPAIPMLRFAFYVGPGLGNCLANDYDCENIDGGGDVGRFSSLTAPRSSTDKVRIAYYDKTNGNLKYATPKSGGNCGDGNWQCNVIHSMGAGLAQAGISMALDQNGNPIIAYEDATDAQSPATLSIARPASAVTQFGSGNCGPLVLYHTWQCDTLDNAVYGSGNVNLAAYTAVAVSPISGLATIAYYEDNSFYNTDYLKVAFQRLQVFLPLVIK